MNSKIISNGILRSLGIIIGSALFLYFLYRIQSVIIYIAIAAVLSLIGFPIVRFLKKRLKFPNTIAVICTILLFLVIISGLISMFIPLIVKQGKNLSLLDINQFENNLEDLLKQINEYFLSINVNLLNEIHNNVDIVDNIKFIPGLVNSILGTIGNFSIGLFSVIFIAFFFMKDSSIMTESIYILVNDKSESRLRKSLGTIKNLLSRYFIGLVFQISILFVIYTTTLLIFGVENAFVIAVLCAILNLVPYIGPLIGGILMVFLTMSSFIGLDFNTVILPKTLYVLGGYLLAQLIDNFLSQPLIFSNSVRSHPLEIFLIIIIGGILFGVVGMVVAVPTYTAIKVILKEFLSENKIVKSLTKNL
ncbi:AI-2E family transporter [Aureivirga marina]|uniref:AI-2E family transporter n=1 Tax=Aureivirga marina TaxID=1182451 RepID=UPI0018C8F2E9|nr:AI-2E family transporter [Aureivirga marina]